MFKMNLELRELSRKWRLAARQSQGAAVEIPNLLARGHMHGIGDGLTVAAEDVDLLLDRAIPSTNEIEPLDP